jgi:tetratricopeptide (TPR) repeat protein
VIEGSVSRAGNRLRINVQLVRVDGDVPLWAERFDRELTDTFAIQDEISRTIVNKLRLTVRSGQRRYDVNVDTYTLYLKGRALLIRGGGPDAKAASEVFQQVIRNDPAFAPAYAGLVEAYGLMSYSTLAPGVVETALPLMERAARTALELDELLSEGHAAMGFIYSRHRDWTNAEKSFRHAIDLNPGLTQTYINYWTTTLLPLERLDEAERVLTAAMQTDPLSAAVLHELGFLRLVAGRFDEAMNHYQRARALDPSLALRRSTSWKSTHVCGQVLGSALVLGEQKGPLWKRLLEGPGWRAALDIGRLRHGRPQSRGRRVR